MPFIIKQIITPVPIGIFKLLFLNLSEKSKGIFPNINGLFLK
jgi:hypothetical protein